MTQYASYHLVLSPFSFKMCFSKSLIRLAASIHTGTFHHPTDRVRITSDRRRKQATNHAQQTGGPLISMHDHRAAIRNIHATWHKHILEQRVLWGKRDAINHRELYAQLSQRFEHQLKLLEELRKALINDLFEQKQQDQERIQQEIRQNSKLLLAALKERTEKMTLQGNYNLCGALERMVYLAKLEKKIPPTVGVQEGLDILAQRSEFTAVLHKEVQARKLVVEDVMACINTLYSKVCKRTKDNEDAMVIVRAARFTGNERAALVVFLKLQDNWLYPLDWIEHMTRKGRKQKM